MINRNWNGRVVVSFLYRKLLQNMTDLSVTTKYNTPVNPPTIVSLNIHNDTYNFLCDCELLVCVRTYVNLICWMYYKKVLLFDLRSNCVPPTTFTLNLRNGQQTIVRLHFWVFEKKSSIIVHCARLLICSTTRSSFLDDFHLITRQLSGKLFVWNVGDARNWRLHQCLDFYIVDCSNLWSACKAILI